MKQHRQMATKVFLGLVLVVAAGLATIVIKDTLARRNPENALPVMEVWWHSGRQEDQQLPSMHLKRDRYAWRFLFTPETGGGIDLYPWEAITPALINPGSLIEYEFTYPPRSVKTSIMAREGEFQEIVGEVKAPTEPSPTGQYIYKVEASWEPNRWVQYYFVIQIPSW